MGPWKTPIFCYVSPAGNNKIAEWYSDLLTSEKADADTFLQLMRKSAHWSMPAYRVSMKGYPKLGELRWVSENKQHRLIGFFGDGVWYAVVGCNHKQNIYSPRNALETAAKYRVQIIERQVATIEYDL